MTNRLIIHFSFSTLTLEVDDIDKLNQISNFCKDELKAYHNSENFEDLTIDNLDSEKSEKFNSLMYELGIF